MTLRRLTPIALTAMLAMAGTACGGGSSSKAVTVGAAKTDAVTDADRALMTKSISSSGIDKDVAKCIVDGLSTKASRADFLLMARAKSDSKMPDSLQTLARDVAIDCAAKVGGLTPTTASSASGSASTAAAAATTIGPAPTTAPAPTTTTTTTPVQKIGKKSSPVLLGTKASIVDDYDLTINSYTPAAGELVKAAADYNDPAPVGSQYVLVNMTVANNGKEDKRVPAYDLFPKAVSASGKSYEASSCNPVLPNPIKYFDDVFKGTSVMGEICFTVADADAAGLTLYFDVIDASFNKTTYYFKLS